MFQLEELLKTHEVTTLWLTAGLFNFLVEQRLGALAGLRQLLTGGEALSVKHVRLALSQLPAETRLINGYGPTECTTFACCYEIPRDLPEHALSVPIGRPIANTEAYVLDARMHPVPVGMPGELYLGGDGQARGYLKRPEHTAERFVPNPFGGAGSRLYRTGDRCAGAQRRHRISGPYRPSSQAPRFPHRTRGDRVVLNRHEQVSQSVVEAAQSAGDDRRQIAWWAPRESGREPSPTLTVICVPIFRRT